MNFIHIYIYIYMNMRERERENERERERDVEWMRNALTHTHHELCLDSHANSQEQTNLERAQPEPASEQRERAYERGKKE